MITRLHDDQYFERCVFPTGLSPLDHATGCGGLPRAALTSLLCPDAPVAYQMSLALLRQADRLGHNAAIVLPSDRLSVAGPILHASGHGGAVVVQGNDACLDKILLLLRRRFGLIIFEPPHNTQGAASRASWKKVMQQLFGGSSVLIGLCTDRYAMTYSPLCRQMGSWSRMVMQLKTRRNDQGALQNTLVRIAHRGLVPYTSQITLPGSLL